MPREDRIAARLQEPMTPQQRRDIRAVIERAKSESPHYGTYAGWEPETIAAEFERDRKARLSEPGEFNPRLAAALERFARLSDPAGFRSEFPNFFPEGFWERKLPAMAELYAPAPVLGVGALGREPVPLWREYQALLLAAWWSAFPDVYVPRLLGAKTPRHAEDFFSQQLYAAGAPDPAKAGDLYPFQAAILMLCRQPWRARFCLRCSRPYVADKQMRKFCSNECFGADRRAKKLAWWNRNRKGKPRRKSQQKRRPRR